MADNTTTTNSDQVIRLVSPETNDQGRLEFVVPVTPEALAGVEVVDVDMVLVMQSGERFVLPQAALRAMTDPTRTQLKFSDGSVVPVADELKKVGAVKPVEGGSYRIQASPIKPADGTTDESGNDFNLGKDDVEGEVAQQQMESLSQQIQQLSQALQNASNSQTTATADQFEQDAGQGPGEGADVANAQEQLTAKVPGAAPKPVIPEVKTVLSANESTLQAQLFHSAEAKVSGAVVADGREYSEVLSSKLYADAPLKVQAGTAAMVAVQSGKVSADFEIPAVGAAESIIISVIDGVSIIPGFSINGVEFNANQNSLTLSDMTQLRLPIEWDLLSDDVSPVSGEFELQVTYTDGSSNTLKTESYRFSYGDFRSYSEVPAGTIGLSSRGWSYDISGSNDRDILVGGDGHDVLRGMVGDDRLDGGRGDDTLIGGSGEDSMDGGTGINTADYADSSSGVQVFLDGSTLNMGGDAAGDTLLNIQNMVGSAYADLLVGDANANRLVAGAGNDTLRGGAGGDLLDGGAGNNTVSYSDSNEGVSVDLQTGVVSNGDAAGDVLVQIHNLIGSQVADRLSGNADGNLLQGLSGADSLEGQGGGDTLEGGIGDDTLAGGEGDDLLDGGVGDDWLDGGVGADRLDGGDGNDTANYSLSSGAVALNLSTGFGSGADAQGDVLSSIERVVGSSFGDVLVGNLSNNTITGGAGDDSIDGAEGNDHLMGNAGNDVILGGAGADTLDGGDGLDTLSYETSAAAVNVSLASGSGSGGDAQGDVLSHFENLIGSAGNDNLEGDANANMLSGGSGDDLIRGAGGNDALSGGSGTDSLEGGLGADTLDGGAGNDTATYARATSGVVVNLADSTRNGGQEAYGDVLVNIEDIIGSDHADFITGDDRNNRLDAGAGNDTLVSSGGTDTLIGGAGVDTLTWATSGTWLGRTLFANDANTDAQYQSIEILDLRTNNGVDSLVVDSTMVRALADIGDSSKITIQLGRGDSVVFADEQNITSSTVGDTTTFINSDGVAIGTVILDQVLTPVPQVGSGLPPVREALNDATFKLKNVTSTQDADQVGVKSMLADSPLVVFQEDGSEVVPQGSPGVGDGTVVLDLVLPGLTGAASGVLYLKSDLSVLPSGFTFSYTALNGDRVSTLIDSDNSSIALKIPGNTQVRVGLSWTVADDGSVIAPRDIIFGVQMLDGGGNALSASGVQENVLDDITFTYGDFRSVSEVEGLGFDVNGNDKLYLAARGWSYDVNGTSGNDIINAGDGHDVVRGLSGNDTILGGRGDDTLIGGSGADSLDGGSGVNVADYSEDTTGVVVDLTSGVGKSGDASGDKLANITHIVGGSGADHLSGNSAANYLTGGLGDDTLTGGQGADTLAGGVGSDTADYSTTIKNATGITVQASLDSRVTNLGGADGDVYIDIENIHGSAGNDYLVGDIQDNIVSGGEGDDTLEGGIGADTLIGGSAGDTEGTSVSLDIASYRLAASAVRASLSDSQTNTGADAAADVYQGIRGLIGSSFSDVLVGNESANRLEGGQGHDTLIGGAGADTLIGGEGSDWASYETAISAVTVSLATNGANLGDAVGDTYDSIENIRGSEFGDKLYGSSGANVIDGGGGNDTLVSGGGGDNLIGGLGTDIVSYENATVAVQAYLSGDEQQFNSGAAVSDTYLDIEGLVGSAFGDSLVGDEGANTLSGKAGDDTIEGGGGGDAIDGGVGFDLASYAGSSSGVTLDLTTGGTGGDASGDSFTNIEGVLGSSSGDSIAGDSRDNWINGGAGNDTITGGGGNDTLLGGDGNDIFKNTGIGRHFYDGGLGTNTVSYDGFATKIDVNLLRTDGNTNGAGGQEFFTNIQNIDGGSENDLIAGDGQNNTLRGGGGDDSLSGAAGNDLLIGDTGSDTLIGGSGADTLNGGDGLDVASYANASASIKLDLSVPTNGSGDAQGDVLIGIESIIGSSFSDTFIAGGSTTNYSFTGGSGVDEISFESSVSAVSVNLLSGLGVGGSAQGARFMSIENITGSIYDDTLQGNSDANLILGGIGNDTLFGSSGGNDTLDGGVGNNVVDYTTISSGSSNSIRFNMTEVNAGYFNVTVGGGSQVDKLKGFETVIGTDGSDSMIGDVSANRFQGGIGKDTLNGGDGADTLEGGADNDVLLGGAGGDSLDGGSGIDTVSYSNSLSGLTVSMSAPSTNTGDAAGDSFTDIENITGSSFDDVITGDTSENNINGGDGADRIDGGLGDDSLIGGAGDDTIISGAGSDSMSGGSGLDVVTYASVTQALTIDTLNNTLGAGSSTAGTHAAGDVIDNTVETIIGASGESTTFLSGARTADTTFIGAAGFSSEVSYTLASSGATVNLTNSSNNSGSSLHDRYVNIVNVTGSSLSDNITGDAADNILRGGAGDDIFQASTGDDSIDGGSGIDTLAFDQIGAVPLQMLVTGAGAGVVTWASEQTTFNSIEVAGLSAQGDTFTNQTSDGLDVDGKAGDDTMVGGSGADTLRGGSGNDSLSGGTGDDLLVGGAGADVLIGGDGTDVADYSSSGALTVDMGFNGSNVGRGTGDAAGDVISADVEVIQGSMTASTTFYGRDSDELMAGGAANDLFWGSDGADVLLGGAGTDTVNYSASIQGVVVDLATNVNTGGQAEGDMLVGIERIIGSTEADSLTASGTAVTFEGGLGNDTLVGGAANDSLRAGDGDDSVVGAGGSDTLDMRSGNNSLNGDVALGGSGNDTVIIKESSISGSFTLDGGTGSDTLQFYASASGSLNMRSIFGGSEDASYQNFEVLDVSKDGVNSLIVISSDAIRALVDNGDSSVLTLRLNGAGDSYNFDIENDPAIDKTFLQNGVAFTNAGVQIAQVNFEYV